MFHVHEKSLQLIDVMVKISQKDNTYNAKPHMDKIYYSWSFSS